MLTIGLARELGFLSKILNRKLVAKIHLEGLKKDETLDISFSPDGMMDVFYKGNYIWHECVEGDTSFFGVESCDTISRIIACIDNGTDWQQHRWTESS